jgi:hypothetical protein
MEPSWPEEPGMNGKQTWMADRIDRKREAPQTKAVREARAMTIRMEARKLIAGALRAYEDTAEAAAFLGDVLDIVGEQLHPRIGRVAAATAFNSRSTDICSHGLNEAIARARAEQLFRQPKAANDGAANG